MAGSTLGKALRKKHQAVNAAKRKAGSLKPASLDLVDKKVRLVGHSLTTLMRNTTANVTAQHGDVAICQTVGGGVRQCTPAELYLLTGSETLPMADDLKFTGGQTNAMLALKLQCRRQADEDLKAVKHTQSLSDADVTSAWYEIQARRLLSGDADFQHQAVYIQPARGSHLLEHWQKSPGSPDSQQGLQTLRDQLEPVLSQPRQMGFILWPVHNVRASHWTLLSLYRRPQPDSTAPAFLWEVQYRESLTVAAESSKVLARTALVLLREALTDSQMAQKNLQQVKTASQIGNTACGFFVAAWMEEAVRQLRGEGVFRVDVTTLNQTAKRLTKWAQAVQTAWKRHHNLPDKAVLVKTEQPRGAASSVQMTAISEAVGQPVAAAKIEPAEIYGCSRCSHAAVGCDRCSPVKLAKKWAAEIAAVSKVPK